MIVRPTPSLSANTRTRSQSTPPRRSNSTNAPLAQTKKDAQITSLAPSPQSPTQTRPGPSLAGSPTHPAPGEPLKLAPSKRRLFRLRRPSSSNADTRPAREGTFHVHGAMSVSALISPPASPSAAPPRPPRNPARVKLAARPSTSSGVPPRVSHLHTAADERELKHAGDATTAAEWDFPLPTGSEFPIQRKKSKSRRFNSSRIAQDASAKTDVPFSTVDRTILEELRQKIRAREGQFITRSGRKYHAFPSAEVPYPRSYDRQVVDLDVWDDLWQLQLGGSITMHMFETPPARVLDLGCGTGTWILNAAGEWKDTHFVGLDVVPLHPDLLQVGSFDLASRITWVQANFLESLPFPNEEFDYVRLVRVARGVPEDKWDALLEEITRVMKHGGAFEMWEEDLHFPGGREENISIIDSQDPTRPPTPPHTDSSHSSEQDKVMPSSTFVLPPHQSSAFSYSFDDVLRMKRSTFEDTRQPLHVIHSGSVLAQTPALLRTLDRPPMNPHDHTLLQTIYDEMHATRFINLEPLSLVANLLPLHFRDVRAPPPIVIMFPPVPIPLTFDERSGPSLLTTNKAMVGDSDSEEVDLAESPIGMFLPPPVLRIHDVGSGAPFISIDPSRYSGFSPSALRRSLSLLGANGHAVRAPHSPARAPFPTNGSIPIAKFGNRELVAGRNPLPNKTVNFDPRSLNLLLALRVNEVLACAEPMWDWVVDFQDSVARSASAMGSSHPSDHPTLRTRRRRRHPKQDALMKLTRQDFDVLMRRFELDMKTRMYLGAALEDRLGWPSYTASSSEERENFEAMCTAWAEYEHRSAAGTTARSGSFVARSPSPRPLLRRRDTEPVADATVRGRAREDPRGRHIPQALQSQTSDHVHASPVPTARTSESDGTELHRRKSAPSSEKPGRPSSRPQTGTSTASSRLSEPDQDAPPSSRTGRIFVAWKA